jgi:hypothetical protein
MGNGASVTEYASGRSVKKVKLGTMTMKIVPKTDMVIDDEKREKVIHQTENFNKVVRDRDFSTSASSSVTLGLAGEGVSPAISASYEAALKANDETVHSSKRHDEKENVRHIKRSEGITLYVQTITTITIGSESKETNDADVYRSFPKRTELPESEINALMQEYCAQIFKTSYDQFPMVVDIMGVPLERVWTFYWAHHSDMLGFTTSVNVSIKDKETDKVLEGADVNFARAAYYDFAEKFRLKEDVPDDFGEDIHGDGSWKGSFDTKPMTEKQLRITYSLFFSKCA